VFFETRHAIAILSPFRGAIAVVLVFFIWSLLACAAPTSEPGQSPELVDIKSAGPYCGIYSVTACLNAVGCKTDIDELWHKKYVGSRRGSTAQELIQAIEDRGCHAYPFQNLTHRELARSTSPMLLHMRASWSDTEFDHWVAFLGVDHDRILILEPPSNTQALSKAELLANWDGFAIGVSPGTIDDSSVTIVSKVDFAYMIVGVGLVIIVAKASSAWWIGTTTKRMSSLAWQIAILIILSSLLSVAFHLQSDIGFFYNMHAVADVSARYHSVKVPEITLNELSHVVKDRSAILLDARRARDFNKGSIEGARNLPVDSTLSERREELVGIRRDDRLILFCQSIACPYGDKVASFLKFNGYTNLAIYRGGYREWSASKQSPSQALSK